MSEVLSIRNLHGSRKSAPMSLLSLTILYPRLPQDSVTTDELSFCIELSVTGAAVDLGVEP